jgi:hypothetical protein
MTDLVTSTFAQLLFFCFPCSSSKRDRNDEESDAEALEKARQWREKMANAEKGGKPPGYQHSIEMRTPKTSDAALYHARNQSQGVSDTGRGQLRPGSL